MTRSPGHGRGMQVRWYLTVSGSRRSAPARPEGYGAGLHSGESPSAACEHAPNDGPCPVRRSRQGTDCRILP